MSFFKCIVIVRWNLCKLKSVTSDANRKLVIMHKRSFRNNKWQKGLDLISTLGQIFTFYLFFAINFNDKIWHLMPI